MSIPIAPSELRGILRPDVAADGATDDTDILQAALDIPGWRVQLPKGRTRVTRPLRMQNFSALEGVHVGALGGYGTEIMADHDGPHALESFSLQAGGGWPFCEVRNLTFNGMGTCQGGPHVHNAGELTLFEACTFTDFKAFGLWHSGQAATLTLRRCVFCRCGTPLRFTAGAVGPFSETSPTNLNASGSIRLDSVSGDDPAGAFIETNCDNSFLVEAVKSESPVPADFFRYTCEDLGGIPAQDQTQPDLLLLKGALNWAQGSRLVHVVKAAWPCRVNARAQCVRTRFAQGDMRCFNETLDKPEIAILGDGGSFTYDWGVLS